MMLITFFDKQGLGIYQDMFQNINLIIGLFQIKVNLVVCSSSSEDSPNDMRQLHVLDV